MTEILQYRSMTRFDWTGVAAALERGRLVALPTDTVYGIACKPEPEALARLFAAKGRAAGKPVALVFPDAQQVFYGFPPLPAAVTNAVEALLPGPVTLVVPFGEKAEGGACGDAERRQAPQRAAGSAIARAATGGGVGVRALPQPAAALFERLPSPLALTSANLAGGADPCSVDEIPEEIRQACEYVLDAGPIDPCRPSTVVDLRPLVAGQPAVILREGAMGRDEIIREIGLLDA
ncbi:MAG: L-threonylcarbamoyladenylate synthase [Thermoleophilia bacterium]